MMVVGAEFIANLNADKIYIDLTYLADPITKKFWLTIQNQSLSTLYFKIINNIPNWTLDTPADGKLGSVASAVTTTFTPIITRANPSAEATDTGNLTIEAYTDSGYTNKIGEAALNVTVYIEDLENWTDVDKSDFDDGTAQGWTGGTVISEVSVEVGGYSYKSAESPRGGSAWVTVYKSFNLPNRNKVRMAFYIVLRGWNNFTYTNQWAYLDQLKVIVDSQDQFHIPATILSRNWSGAGAFYTPLWLKIEVDLSEYKNQTKTLKIHVLVRGYRQPTVTYPPTASFVVDRIVVAGKD